MSLLFRYTRLVISKAAGLNQLRNLTTLESKTGTRILPQLVSNNNNWIWHNEDKIKLPCNNIKPIQIPNNIFWIPPLEESIKPIKEINEPNTNKNSIEAARMIIIRRKKMKKHKLKKLRKRMKHEWAKIRQKRELKKEKAFQAVLIQQCKEAEAFSAEKYVQERLDKLHEIIIPKRWKGRRLPEFIIREKMGLPPK